MAPQNLSTYIPQDRLRALACGESLPDRTTGSALFADISGFTPLTEALCDLLGSRQGAEELTRHLDAVYTALIAEIEQYGGSVLGFAGDAVTCWFDEQLEWAGSAQPSDGSPSRRAAACAFALQRAMRPSSAIALPNGSTIGLALKVTVASGPIRRFVVGDPAVHFLDALAGATVTRTSTAEHLARPGEVLLDESTAHTLSDALTIREWRTDAESGARFAVGARLQGDATMGAVTERTGMPDEAVLQAWIPRPLYEREQSGQGMFLTEFRPCVGLFVRFVGIDYEADDARAQLDTFIRRLQGIAARYEGAVLQLTIGDKGSYIYLNFGALSAHEDDARRAVKTALELSNTTDLQLHMGITQGVLRTGTYGGTTRRTYGAMGDEVNLAARLMSNAAPGEILISGPVQKATAADFVFEPHAPLPMKGKAEPLPVFAVMGERRARAVRLPEPQYALPMVGRRRELQAVEGLLNLAEQGQGQIIGVVAEAGMGKSRLVAELIRSARRRGFVGYGGACQSDAINTPYQPWKSIWQAFFSVDPELPLKRQMRLLEGELADQAPERAQALPLLGIVLDLEIPDNDFTQTLEPQYRQSALWALLEECLRAAAADEPILIVVEDMHWIDPLSHDLLEELARALTASPICFVLAYRPPQLARLEAPRLEAMPNFTRIELHELNTAEAEQAIRAKLAQLYPARGAALPEGLVDNLMARSQGNPFYLEELLNYVRDRGLDPADLNRLELPDSLHTLILSRIDRLTEREKTTLRVASIVGRLFRTAWLTGYYPALGELSGVESDLEQLARLDITALDTPEPELAYLFKHIVTHEVTYESLPFATRAQLHEQLARFLEVIGAPVDAVAHHYGQSHNGAKQQEYWLKAGDAAYQAFANEAALDYYGRLSPLSDPREQADLNLKLAGAYYALGRLSKAREQLYLACAGLGHPLPTTRWRSGGAVFRELARQAGHRLWLARRPTVAEDDDADGPAVDADRMKLARAYLLLSNVDALSDKAGLIVLYTAFRALNLSEAARRSSPELAHAYANLGYSFGFFAHSVARAYMRRAQAALDGLENASRLSGLGTALIPANLYALAVGDWQTCEHGCVQAMKICERLGDRVTWARNLSLLGYCAWFQGQVAHSLELITDFHQDALVNNHAQHQAMGLAGQVWYLFHGGQTAEAVAVAEGALPLFAKTTGTRIPESNTHALLAGAYLRQGQFSQARQAAETAGALIAHTPLPFYAHVFIYGQIADVYLALWEQEQRRDTKEAAESKALARQACRSMHRLARIFPIGQPGTLRRQGSYDWLEGKPDRARRAWQKSLAAAQKLAMPYEEAFAYYELGRHASGAERDANLARANEIFERLGVVGFDPPFN